MPFVSPYRQVNIYNDSLCPPGSDQTVLTYTVPSNNVVKLFGSIHWGDYDAEFLIWVDGVIRGGGRTSPAQRTLQLRYEYAPIIATAGEVVRVTANHAAPADRVFRSTLLCSFVQ